MANTTELIDQIILNHNGDIQSLAAWCLGYVSGTEYNLNLVRCAVSAEPRETLRERLAKQIDERIQGVNGEAEREIIHGDDSREKFISEA